MEWQVVAISGIVIGVTCILVWGFIQIAKIVMYCPCG